MVPSSRVYDRTLSNELDLNLLTTNNVASMLKVVSTSRLFTVILLLMGDPIHKHGSIVDSILLFLELVSGYCCLAISLSGSFDLQSRLQNIDSINDKQLDHARVKNRVNNQCSDSELIDQFRLHLDIAMHADACRG